MNLSNSTERKELGLKERIENSFQRFLIRRALPQKGKACLIDSVLSCEPDTEIIDVAVDLDKCGRYTQNGESPELFVEVAAQSAILMGWQEALFSKKYGKCKVKNPKNYLLTKANMNIGKPMTSDMKRFIVRTMLALKVGCFSTYDFYAWSSKDMVWGNFVAKGRIIVRGEK